MARFARSPSSESDNLESFKESIVIFIIAVACFANSYDGSFAFDDSEAIIGNKDLQSNVTHWSELFRHDFWGGNISKKTSHKSYRPLTVLSFRLDYFLAGGLYPKDFHVTNIILHGIVSILVLRSFSTILKREHVDKFCQQISFQAALLFAVHPLHAENVSAIVGRADLLCALVFFLSFLLYDVCCRREGKVSHPFSLRYLCCLSFSMLAVISSVLCKEQGITALIVCSLYDIFVCNPIVFHHSTFRTFINFDRHLIIRQLVLILTGSLILLFRWWIMGYEAPEFQVVDNPHSFVNNTILRMLNYNYLYALNCWLLINPWWLCFDWSMGCVPIIETMMEPRLLVVLFFLVVLGAAFAKCFLLLRLPQSSRVVVMSFVFLIAPFLPASNILFRVGFVVAERILYIPSAGSSLLIILGLHRLSSYYRHSPGKVSSYALSILVLLYIARSIQRSNEWRSELTLFESGERVCPLNAKVHYNIGKVHADRGNSEFAIKKYRLAIRLYPDYDQAMNNLANMLKERGGGPEAEQLLMRAVQIRPTFSAAWMNLGIVQAELGKHSIAEQSYRTALVHRKNYPDCYYNLGNMYLEIGRHDDALSSWKRAVTHNPGHVSAWTNAIILLDKLDRLSDVDTVAREALTANPEAASLHYNYANTLGKDNRYEESELHFLEAVRLEPNLPQYLSNLGVLYHRWGKYVEAEKFYNAALALDANNNNTRDNLQKLRKFLKSN